MIYEGALRLEETRNIKLFEFSRFLDIRVVSITEWSRYRSGRGHIV